MREVTLDEIADLKKQSVKPEAILDGTIYVGLEHVFSDGTILPERINNGDLASNKFQFGSEHILYGKLRPYLRKIAKPNFSGISSTDIIPILPINNKVDKTYLYHYLRTPFMVKYATQRCSGANLPRISPKEIAKFKIPLPPLPQQKKIAAILDAADAYRQQTKALIAKYEELTQSLFLEMFGDPVTNPKGWEEKTVVDLVKDEKYSLKRGPFGGALKKEIFVEDGYLVYEQYHALNNDFSMERYFIDEKKYKELIGFAVKPNDIIISCSGVYLGKLAVIPKGAKAGIINQALLKVTLDESKMRNDFFVFHFTQERFKQTFFDSNRGGRHSKFSSNEGF